MNRYYISHHGIDGQKWGVRNGPPYPLDKNQKNNTKSSSNSNTKRILKIGFDYIKKILLFNNQSIVDQVIMQDNLQNAAKEMKRRNVYTMHISELYK